MQVKRRSSGECAPVVAPDVLATPSSPSGGGGSSPLMVSVPVSAEMLLAACMVRACSTGSVSEDGLSRMSVEEVRSWSLGELLTAGAAEVRAELQSEEFACRYRACGDGSWGGEYERFLRVASARLAEAFGFGEILAGAA